MNTQKYVLAEAGQLANGPEGRHAHTKKGEVCCISINTSAVEAMDLWIGPGSGWVILSMRASDLGGRKTRVKTIAYPELLNTGSPV